MYVLSLLFLLDICSTSHQLSPSQVGGNYVFDSRHSGSVGNKSPLVGSSDRHSDGYSGGYSSGYPTRHLGGNSGGYAGRFVGRTSGLSDNAPYVKMSQPVNNPDAYPEAYNYTANNPNAYQYAASNPDHDESVSKWKTSPLLSGLNTKIVPFVHHQILSQLPKPNNHYSHFSQIPPNLPHPLNFNNSHQNPHNVKSTVNKPQSYGRASLQYKLPNLAAYHKKKPITFFGSPPKPALDSESYWPSNNRGTTNKTNNIYYPVKGNKKNKEHSNTYEKYKFKKYQHSKQRNLKAPALKLRKKYSKRPASKKVYSDIKLGQLKPYFDKQKHKRKPERKYSRANIKGFSHFTHKRNRPKVKKLHKYDYHADAYRKTFLRKGQDKKVRKKEKPSKYHFTRRKVQHKFNYPLRNKRPKYGKSNLKNIISHKKRPVSKKLYSPIHQQLPSYQKIKSKVNLSRNKIRKKLNKSSTNKIKDDDAEEAVEDIDKTETKDNELIAQIIANLGGDIKIESIEDILTALNISLSGSIPISPVITESTEATTTIQSINIESIQDILGAFNISLTGALPISSQADLTEKIASLNIESQIGGEIGGLDIATILSLSSSTDIITLEDLLAALNITIGVTGTVTEATTVTITDTTPTDTTETTETTIGDTTEDTSSDATTEPTTTATTDATTDATTTVEATTEGLTILKKLVDVIQESVASSIQNSISAKELQNALFIDIADKSERRSQRKSKILLNKEAKKNRITQNKEKIKHKKKASKAKNKKKRN